MNSENAQISLIQLPVITEQPADQTAPVGTTAVFTVKATGADKYQWQVNRGEGYVDLSNSPSYSGVKTDTLSVVSKELFATYKYRVVVSNAAGEVKSSYAKLIPILPPVITQQPENQTVGEGSYASFTVKQNNAKTIQWQVDRGDDKGFVDLGETATYKNVKSETLSVKGTTSTANYKFRVVLANEAGQVVSDTVRLNVVFKPVITKQPTNQTVGEGSFAKFTVKYDSADSIRWQVDRGEGYVDLLSDTPTYKDVATATLSVKGTESTAKYKFKAVLTNLAGETKSNPVTLTVVPKVVITTQPTNQPGAKDAYSTFTVEAENADVIHWQVDRGDGFVNLTETATYKGTSTKALTVKGSDSTANYKFRAVLSNLAGEVVSNTVRINPYILPPVIKTQPVDQDALVGSYAVFTASVTDADSLQWQVNRNDGKGYVDLGETATYKNATTDALSVKATASTATYSFRLVATNLAGETKSNVVKLTAWSPIVITSQPENQQGVIGATVQFTVTAKNATSVQWQVNRNDGNGFVDLGETPTFQNAKTYTLSVKVTENTATYTFRAVLKNKVQTVESGTATIVLLRKPEIVTQPTNQTANFGEQATFSTVIKNADTIHWQVNRNDGNGYVDIVDSATYSGSTTSTLKVLATESTSSYTFRVKATNDAGSVTSNAVKLICVIDIKSVSLSKTSVTIKKGNTQSLTYTLSPSNYNVGIASVNWTSSNTSVATVNSSGTITAKAKGSATITLKVTSTQGTTVSATCSVTVTEDVIDISSVSLSKTSMSIKKGSTGSLTYTLSPSNYTVDISSVNWTSSNTNVATVNSSGTVTAKAKGSATITLKVTSTQGTTVSATCSVTVTEDVIDISSVSLSKTSMSIKKGSTGSLTYTLSPSNYNVGISSVNWTSSNTSVATVSDGTVTAKAKGSATITLKVTSAQGTTVSATCSVTVTETSVSGSFTNASATVTIGEKYYLKGTASVSGSTLKTVTVNTLYYDKSDYPYSEVTKSFTSGTSISLESYSSTYVLDTSKAPFSTPGTYTLNLWVKAADETTAKVSTMTLTTLESQPEITVSLDTSSTIAGSNIAFWPIATFSKNASVLKFELLDSSGTETPFIRAYYYNMGVSTTETSFCYTSTSDASELATGNLSLGMYIPAETAAGQYNIRVTVTVNGSSKFVDKPVSITKGSGTWTKYTIPNLNCTINLSPGEYWTKDKSVSGASESHWGCYECWGFANYVQSVLYGAQSNITTTNYNILPSYDSNNDVTTATSANQTAIWNALKAAGPGGACASICSAQGWR